MRRGLRIMVERGNRHCLSLSNMRRWFEVQTFCHLFAFDTICSPKTWLMWRLRRRSIRRWIGYSAGKIE
ncbi:hypothetical protein TM49_03350 [Martelella endophytica]|uniref:Uncharacterized protein n=1 Tax=Martelella endophytica TaxID=1486262 RepID=A0A0D5LNR0_MAREN|nr:hypothetical protein TM49_03350 [Martelella endophytica]